MTGYMPDTSIVSHLLKKHPAVARRVVAAPITTLRVSAITQGELLFGLAGRHGAPRCRSRIPAPGRRFAVGCNRGRDLRTRPSCRQARAQGARDDYLLIGARALSVDAVLVTNDRAIAQLPALLVEDWTEETR